MLRRVGSNHRPSGYEPDELPLLYFAMWGAKVRVINFAAKQFDCLNEKTGKTPCFVIYFSYSLTSFVNAARAAGFNLLDNPGALVKYGTCTACCCSQFLVNCDLNI